MKEPNEELMTRWIDGELTQSEKEEMQRYLDEHPELVEERESALKLAESLRAEIAGELEVPSSEFFLGRINHEIDRLEGDVEPVQNPQKQGSSPRSWLMPLMAAAAALAVGFFGGFQFGAEGPEGKAQGTEVVANSDHTVLFSPDQQVSVELLEGDEATLILLEGVDSLPESLELAGESSDMFFASHYEGAGWE